MNVNIQIEKIDELIAALNNFSSAAIAPKAEIKEEAKEKEKKAKAETKITEAEVRKALVSLSTPENRPKIREILDKYGAKNVSSLNESDYEAVLKDLEGLK